MASGWLAHARIGFLALGLFIVAGAPTAVAQSANAIADLDAQVEQLHGQGRYAEAVEVAKRSLALAEKALGPDHPSIGNSLNSMAASYHLLGRYAEAEQLYKRSLEIREKALGPDHADIGQSLSNLAALHYAQGRYGEAEPLYQRSLAIREKALGPDHPDVGNSLMNLAVLYDAQGRYVEAEPLYKRSLAIREKALGPDHPDVGHSLSNLAVLYGTQDRYAEAEPLYKRSLAIREKALGPDHPDVGNSLDGLAGLYRDLGRYAEAEPLLKRSLALFEKALGLDHPAAAKALNNLALLFRAQGRHGEAEALYRRSLAIREKALGADHPAVGQSLNNLAELLWAQGRYSEAEPLYKRSLALLEKAPGPELPEIGTTLNNLAAMYYSQKRFADAEQHYRRGLASIERVRGSEHALVATTLNNLGALYAEQGRHADAEPLLTRSLALREKILGPDHLEVGASLNNLASLAVANSDWSRAVENWRRSTAILQRRFERRPGGTTGGSSKGEAQQNSWHFTGLVRSAYRQSTQEGGEPARLAAEMFEIAQWGLDSEVAASLAQMAARSAGRSPELARLVRERQDLVAEWSAKDKLLIAARSEKPERRNPAGEKVLSERLASIDARLAVIDAGFATDFPDYAALASPRPIQLAEVQASLRDDEALVLFLDMDNWPNSWVNSLPEETFVWVVTRTAMRWSRIDRGSKALATDVAALRCGLDATNWQRPADESRDTAEMLASKAAQRAHAAGCHIQLRTVPTVDGAGRTELPFDAGRAHALYKDLFGQAGDLINGRHLLVVPSGPLTELPFQVLITDLPESVLTEEHRREVAIIGAALSVIPDEKRLQLPTGLDGGVHVVRTIPGGAAERAGIIAGDIIFSIAGARVTDSARFTELLRSRAPRSGVEIGVLRNFERLEKRVVLGAIPRWKIEPVIIDASRARGVRWLAREHAITVLPSVSSLKALRRVSKPSVAARPMIGFGNPLLDGPDQRYAPSAGLARSHQRCLPAERLAGAARGGTKGGASARLALRNDIADLSQIRLLTPLPETAAELCAVARDLGAGPGDIHLGGGATEARIKALSTSGELARYRILHFATHGTLAGEIKGAAEPGLILTPPATPSGEDDGYLSGSEIAGLKLDADWVILSACNTAGAGDGGGESLSGLARAFFYAGARALLVSHWAVDSDATVKLIASAARAITRGKSVGRAEAVRRAMLAMIDHGAPHEAHPAYWAPFVVVGEGAAAR